MELPGVLIFVYSLSYTKPLSRCFDGWGVILRKRSGMIILQLKPHLTIKQFKERMQKERKVFCIKRWQILHAISTHRGISAQPVGLLLGCSVHMVKRTVQLYNKRGAAFVEAVKWGGRRVKLCLLPFDEEVALLQSWEQAALKGSVLVARQLREAVEQKAGHTFSDDYL